MLVPSLPQNSCEFSAVLIAEIGLILLFSADERSRTSTPLRAQEPESCASANSATSAGSDGNCLPTLYDNWASEFKGRNMSSNRNRMDRAGYWFIWVPSVGGFSF